MFSYVTAVWQSLLLSIEHRYVQIFVLCFNDLFYLLTYLLDIVIILAAVKKILALLFDLLCLHFLFML